MACLPAGACRSQSSADASPRAQKWDIEDDGFEWLRAILYGEQPESSG